MTKHILRFRKVNQDIFLDIKRGKLFKSISSLTKHYPIKSIMPHVSSKKELQAAYYTYPNYKEKIRKFGLIALELK